MSFLVKGLLVTVDWMMTIFRNACSLTKIDYAASGIKTPHISSIRLYQHI